jgi:hypothetical protein
LCKEITGASLDNYMKRNTVKEEKSNGFFGLETIFKHQEKKSLN